MDRDDVWIDLGSVWEHNAAQGSEDWKDMHNRFLTASRFGAAAGHSPFSTPEQLMEELRCLRSGLPGKQFTPEQEENMKLGVVMEPFVRDWYSKDRCEPKGLKVIEKGLIVPKWDTRIGASLDGLVTGGPSGTGGMIEIKCPKKMYWKLSKHREECDAGLKFSSEYHDHIFETHYDQMQGCMAIMGVPWCDYIVYAVHDKQIMVDRVFFNNSYWTTTLYPTLDRFLLAET